MLRFSVVTQMDVTGPGAQLSTIRLQEALVQISPLLLLTTPMLVQSRPTLQFCVLINYCRNCSRNLGDNFAESTVLFHLLLEEEQRRRGASECKHCAGEVLWETTVL